MSDVVTVTASEGDGERGPVTVDDQMMLRPGTGAVNRGRAHVPPFERPDVGPVHGTVIQVQKLGSAQLGQQSSVQPRPDSGLGPVSQPAPSRHPGTPDCFRWDVAPGDTGSQHVQDAHEGRPVRNTQPPGVAVAALGGRGQKRSHLRP